MGAFLAILRRDLKLGLRSGVDCIQPLIFFVMALTLFPLGVGPSPEILERIGVGIIWALALLAVMLSLDRLFQADADDGSLEQFALADLPLELTVLAKCLAHWIMSGLLLVIASPLLALLLHQSAETIRVLAFALLLGTPVLTLIGSVGAALLVGARQGGVLIALLVLPLYIPVLIFGVSAVESAVMGLGGNAQLLILGAILLAALALTPFAAAAALRLSME